MAKKKPKKSSGKGTLVIGIVIVLAIVIILVFAFTSGGEKVPQEQIDIFAECLTESGAVMYGTFWCPHCAATKKMFGTGFDYINYVECDPRGDNEQSELCIEKGIDNYDTWEFADGSRVVGEPTFEELAQGSGCAVPVGESE